MELLKELADIGVDVASPPCNIADAEALGSALQMQLQTMPPIKGCIQSSMVLKVIPFRRSPFLFDFIQDALFQTMSHEDFQAAIHPKVQGSWNLHLQLPRDIDFYILLSSAGGVIGTRGQSNYAAGNTYQDALAQYRVSRGLKCCALDLGMVLAVGFAAEMSILEMLGNTSLAALGYRIAGKSELFDWSPKTKK